MEASRAVVHSILKNPHVIIGYDLLPSLFGYLLYNFLHHLFLFLLTLPVVAFLLLLSLLSLPVF